jgi:hypothetical protein
MHRIKALFNKHNNLKKFINLSIFLQTAGGYGIRVSEPVLLSDSKSYKYV